MDCNVSFFTIATADLDAARAFYVGGLGWAPLLDVAGEIIFFQVGPGVVLGMFDAAKFAEDLGPASRDRLATAAPGGFTLSQNVASPDQVDQVLRSASRAGGTIVKPGQHAAFGGYHGHFADPNGVIWEIAHNPGWRVDETGKVILEAIEPGQP